MKKLLILAGVALTAVATQAAAYTWQSKTNYTYLPETTTKAAGTAYLFNAGTYSQSALLTALRGREVGVSASDYLTTLAIASAVNYVDSAFVGGTMTGGQIAASAGFDYDGVEAGNNWTGYFAMIVDDNVYLSTEATIAASALAAGTAVKFGSQATTSKAAVFGETVSYGGAGWYSTAPEPTSGLLMLLGMAALALKRKRA